MKVLVLFTLFGCVNTLITDQKLGEQFLQEYDVRAANMYNENLKAAWAYYTNITKENEQKMIATNLKSSLFDKEAAINASNYDWRNFNNETVKRIFEMISIMGFEAIDDTAVLEKISQLEAEMTNIYSTGKACLKDNRCLQLEPGLVDIVTMSRDYDELLTVWKGFRDATGKKMRQMYTEFVNAMNKAIKFSGYKDTGEYWRARYETPNFEEDVKNLYEQFQPLYEQLHAYVRRQLKKQYGEDKFPSTGHIPAHLFGNMWGQDWNNIFDLVTPYPNATKIDITNKMKEKGFTVESMFRHAEDFFLSIGMEPMTNEFWEYSMLEKPSDRDVVCHASAWDFYDGKDFRIKQCTTVDEDSFLTVHHEMGHIVYYMNYAHLPVVFREGANPGFHEAMGDVIALSFQTQEHMQAIGLIDIIPNDTESDINFLMRMALEKVAFLPFSYLIDQWRWSVFRGDTTPDTYNTDWWKLRCGYQGISPPVQRSEDDFDPGAKYHIPGNTPYIRYFVANVLQFQWHEALCKIAGHNGPLHKCDIYRSAVAGNRLRDLQRMGSSRPWTETLQALTGSQDISAHPLVEYFKPLHEWLIQQNRDAGEKIGWDDSCPYVVSKSSKLSFSFELLPFLGVLLILGLLL